MARITTPLRLTRADFDALAAGSPWAGPRRLELGPRMLRWARGVARRLEDQGVTLRPVVPGLGATPRKGKTEHAQRVWLQEEPCEATGDAMARRSASMGAPRSPSVGTPRLSLRVDGARVEIALEVPSDAVAFVRLRERLTEDAWCSAFLTAADELPEPFGIALGTDSAGRPELAADWLSAVDRGVAAGRSLKIVWSLAREAALAHTGNLDGELEDGVAVLLPFFKLLSGVEPEPGSGRPSGRSSHSARQRRLSMHRATRAAEARTLIERGSRVRVLSGPFAGKVGVVKELDATKGRAFVMLGLLATRIDVKDLATNQAGARPTLSSSHRKPLGLR